MTLRSGEVKSTLTNRSSVEVFGWTELGTKIVINGDEIPVNEQVLFLDLLALTKKGNITKLQAISLHGSKEIVRDFIVK